MTAPCRLRQGKGYEACADEVRVERRGKSSPVTRERRDAVNSIRSNTGMGEHIGWPGRSRGGLSVLATVRRDR